MDTNIKRKGRFAIAWVVIVTMVFATMYTPFAFAETTVDVHGVTKVGAQTQYVIPAENDFVFIKQATADNKTYVLWTRDALTVAEQHAIIDGLLKNLPGGDKSIYDLYVKKDPTKGVQYDLVKVVSGFGPINVTPKNGTPYSYTISQNDAGQIILDNPAKKISHIYYGQYNESYTISVTKAVTLNESSLPDDIQGINGSIYVSLFTTYENGEYSGLLGQKEIVVKDGASVAPAVFTVSNTGTYYVVETYANGDPVEEPGMMFGKTLVSIDNTAADGITVTTTSQNNVSITNNLTTEEPKGTGTIEVNKILNGKDLAANMFQFQLIETQADFETPVNGGIDETVGNLAALAGQPGKVVFSTIPYTNDETHYYIIKEKPGNDPTITYDKSIIHVTMTVTEDENDEGKLIAEASYSPEGKTFTNTYEAPEVGTIPVTKTVEIPEGTTFKTPYTFYVALFDENGDMYGDIDPIPLTITDGNNLQASGSFTDLDLEKVYNVYEVYKVGDDFVKVETDPIDDTVTSPEDTPWKATEYTNNEGIDEFGEDLTAPTVTVNNVYDTEEDGLLGAITVVKKVTVNKKAFNSNLTFHVGLFDSEDLTTPIDMKDLVMDGKSETSKSFENLEAGTYYIAETDASGKPLAGTAKELGFEITVDGNDENLATVEMIGDDVIVELVNNFKKEEFPLTGDNSNMNLWIFLAMLGVAGAIAPFAFGKKEEAND